MLSKIFHKLKPVLLTVGLATCLLGTTLWAIFQGLLLPRDLGRPSLVAELALSIPPWKLAVFYLAWTGLPALAAIIHKDPGVALGSYLAAWGLGAALTYYALALPGMIQSDSAFREILARASVNWTFLAFFPFPLFLGLIGTIAGAAVAESLV